MIKTESVSQIKWVLLVLVISFVLVSVFENTVLQSGIVVKAQHTFLGLNLFLEILIFLVFSIFVVFGIKGYFEFYSKKISNIIIRFRWMYCLEYFLLDQCNQGNFKRI